MLSDERIAEIKARIEAAPDNLDSQTRFVYRIFHKLRNPDSLGVLLDGDGSDDWKVADIWANSSRDIRDLLEDIHSLREIIDILPHESRCSSNYAQPCLEQFAGVKRNDCDCVKSKLGSEPANNGHAPLPT